MAEVDAITAGETDDEILLGASELLAEPRRMLENVERRLTAKEYSAYDRSHQNTTSMIMTDIDQTRRSGFPPDLAVRFSLEARAFSRG